MGDVPIGSAMDRARYQDELESVEKLISRESIELARLRLAVCRVERGGQQTNALKRLIKNLEGSLASHEAERDALAAALGAAH